MGETIIKLGKLNLDKLLFISKVINNNNNNSNSIYHIYLFYYEKYLLKMYIIDNRIYITQYDIKDLYIIKEKSYKNYLTDYLEQFTILEEYNFDKILSKFNNIRRKNKIEKIFI